MSILFGFIGMIFFIIAALATPSAIGYGLYIWVFDNVEFKVALWNGFVLWISMLVGGIVLGFTGTAILRLTK